MKKVIEDFPNYSIDEFGNIYKKDGNLKTLVKDKRGGYIRVWLWKDNKNKQFKVHRLVATHFIDNPGNKPEVNHIDGDKTNNRASNLEWATRSENVKHAFEFGFQTPPKVKGERHGKAKLTNDQVIEIKEALRNNITVSNLALKYNVSLCIISSIKHGRTWKHL